MAQKIDAQKLLPSAKSSAIVKFQTSQILVLPKTVKISSIVKAISSSSSDSTTDEKENQQNAEVDEIHNKLVKIQKLLESDFLSSQRELEKQRKKEEKEKFEEEEKKLEDKKPKGGINFPKVNIPKVGLFEKIKSFIFFTALGWLFNNTIQFLPKLREIGKIIDTVYPFVEGLFGNLFNGFMTFVKFGKDLKDNAIGTLALIRSQIGGGKFEDEFKKLENQFDNFVNISIIAGLLSLDIAGAAVDEWKKWNKKNNKPSKPSNSSNARGAKQAAKQAAERQAAERQKSTNRRESAKRQRSGRTTTPTTSPPPTGKPPEVKAPKPTGKPDVTPGRRNRKAPPSKGGKTPGWVNKILNKVKSGPLGKLVGPFSGFLKRAVPFASAAFSEYDAQQRFKRGDVVGGTLARTGAILDGFQGAALMASLPFFGTIIGAKVGAVIAGAGVVAGAISTGIDILLLIRDILDAFNIKTFNRGGVIGTYQRGGTTTRGGKPAKQKPQRKITPIISKPIKRKPKKSQPGKDVGGENKIKLLYGDPTATTTTTTSASEETPVANQSTTQQTNEPNPYKAITSVAKEFKNIPLIGEIMSAGADGALGEKLDRKVIKSFSSSITFLVESLVSQQMNQNMGSIINELRTFSEGGFVPPSRELKSLKNQLNIGEIIEKIIGTEFERRIDAAIQSVKSEAQKAEDKKKREEISTSPSLGVDGGNIVEGGDADFWTLVAVASLESGNPQGRADVAQTIYNRVVAAKTGVNFYQKSNTIKGHIVARIQYQPVRETGTNGEAASYALWEGIQDKESAIRVVSMHKNKGINLATKMIEETAAAILNPELQRKAAEFVGGRTDFSATGRYTRHPGAHSIEVRGGHDIGFFVGPESIAYGRTNPGPAVVPQLGARVIMPNVSAPGVSGSFHIGEMIAHSGPGGFIQGGSGSRRTHGIPLGENAFAIHFHLSPPEISRNGYSKARNVAFKAVKMMLARGSTVYHGNAREYASSKMSDAELRDLIAREQRAHTAPSRTQGGIDIQEIHPRLGKRTVFPLAVGQVSKLKEGYGREAIVLGSGGVLIAHGAQGSTASQVSQLERAVQRQQQTQPGQNNTDAISRINNMSNNTTIDFPGVGKVRRNGENRTYLIDTEGGGSARITREKFLERFQQRSTRISRSRTYKFASIYSGHADMIPGSGSSTAYGTDGGIGKRKVSTSRIGNISNEAFVNDLIARKIGEKTSMFARYNQPTPTRRGREPNSNWERALRDLDQGIFPLEIHHDQPKGSMGLMMGREGRNRMSNPIVRELNKIYRVHGNKEEKGFFRDGGAILEVSALTPEILKNHTTINSHVETESTKIARAINNAQRMKQGGQILPMKSDIPIPDTFASYNSPQASKPRIAVQIIQERVMVPIHQDTISFPILVRSNLNNMEDSFNKARGY